MKTMLFNPYTGTPRHPDDIKSDPQGLLIVEPDAPVAACPDHLDGRHVFDEAGQCYGDTCKAKEPQPSPTAGMTLEQRIVHVFGRTNAAGYVEFGSVQAVRALVMQVLRDIKAPEQSATYGQQDAFNKRAADLIRRAANALNAWDRLPNLTRQRLVKELRDFAAWPAESMEKDGPQQAGKPRPELLALAEQCGARLTGTPDGHEAVTVVFTVESWRKFDAHLSASDSKEGA